MKSLRALPLVALLVCCLTSCRERYDAERDLALKNTLAGMRSAIASFRADQGRQPHNLEELVPKYLPAIPPDPITGAQTWRLTTEETVQPSSDFQPSTGPAAASVIIDVHSGAPGADRDGVLYSNY